MLAERHRNGAEMIARGAIQMHVPRGAEGVRGDRAEIAVFGTEFLRQLAVGPRLVAQVGFLGRVRARPGIAAVAEDHGRGHTGLDRHGGERHAENLAGAAVVERGGKARIDAEPLADLLMMGIALVGPAADDAVDLAHLEAGVVDRVLHRFDQKIETGHARQAAEAAVADADDGAGVAQLVRRLDRGRSQRFEHFAILI